MRLNVKKGKTLLVDGPASVSLLSGSVTVFGARLKVDSKIIVRTGKRLPFEVLRDAVFELALSESSSYLEVEGSAIPKSWKDTVETLLHSKKPLSILVIGGVDSGKTGFCTYLANRGLEEKRRVAIIDGDVGQSDIGPPATIGLARLKEPVVDLYGIYAENIIFVGATSPSRALNASLNAFKTLKEKSSEMNVNLLIINTDGWIEGEEAIDYKSQIVESLAPSAVVVLQEGDELEPLLKRMKSWRTFVIESPTIIRKRSQEMRRALRGLAYRKYLKDAKVRTYFLNCVKIGNSLGPLTETNLERRNMEKGLLVGLEDEKGVLLGLGILCSIDLERKSVKVYTPVNQKVGGIYIGQVKLNKDGKEIPPNQS